MANVTVSASDVLICRMAPAERSFQNRIIGLIALFGVGTGIAVLPGVIGVTALAGASFTDLRLIPLVLIMFLAAGVANMINDIIDAERDKTKWPLRPLAAGLLSGPEAVVYMAILSAITIVIALVVFKNWLFLTLGLVVLTGNLVYSQYLRDNVGYLTVVVPMALVPVAVWSALSPETVLTPLPWLLALFLAVEQLAAEITHEGLDPAIPALFVRPRPTTERALYVALVIAVFFVGVAIYVYAQISWLFVVVLAVLTALLLTLARNLGDNRSREKLESSFKVAMTGTTIYFLLLAVFAWIK